MFLYKNVHKSILVCVYLILSFQLLQVIQNGVNLKFQCVLLYFGHLQCFITIALICFSFKLGYRCSQGVVDLTIYFFIGHVIVVVYYCFVFPII